MAQFKTKHNITLNKEGLRPRKGDVVELTIKRVEQIHEELETVDEGKWKHLVPVFERIEEK